MKFKWRTGKRHAKKGDLFEEIMREREKEYKKTEGESERVKGGERKIKIDKERER